MNTPPPRSTLFPYTTLFRSTVVPMSLSHVFRMRPSRRSMVTGAQPSDRKSTRLNSSHLGISYAVFCLKKKKVQLTSTYRDLKIANREMGVSDVIDREQHLYI